MFDPAVMAAFHDEVEKIAGVRYQQAQKTYNAAMRAWKGAGGFSTSFHRVMGPARQALEQEERKMVQRAHQRGDVTLPLGSRVAKKIFGRAPRPDVIRRAEKAAIKRRQQSLGLT